MQKSEGVITEYGDDYKVEKMLFTYSDDEMQENKINRENAKLVLNPKFIPFYPSLLKEGYSYLECLVYGFIDFFLSNNDRFYCTNEQLGELFNSSEKTISIAVKKLKDNGLIDVGYSIKSGGGKVRFVKIVNSDFTKTYSGTLQKCKGIENKKIDNNIINKNLENLDLEISSNLKQKENSGLLNTYGDLTFEEIYNLYYHKSGHKPSKEKCRKVFEGLHLDEEGVKLLKKDLQLFKFEYKYGIKNQMYRPGFEKYVGGFNAEGVNEEYRIKTIIKYHMENRDDIDKMKKRYKELCETFGDDYIKGLVKQYGKAKNKITLNIN